MTKFLVLAALGTFLTLFTAPAAHAKECEGVRLPNQVQVDGTSLRLNGMGVREATVFKVNVYVAGLYVATGSRDGKAIAGAPEKKRLVLHFIRDVDKEKMVEAFKEGLKKTAGSSFGAFKSKLAKLNRWMADIKEGQRLTFTYVPEKGLEVRVGHRAKGVLEGADFARAFFEIWLGSTPPNKGLKTGLLGGKCG